MSSPYLLPPPTPNPDQAKGVTVEEIVSGTRCSPLTLKEFEEFLIHEEHTVENLQFIVWYRSYCQRFKALAPEYQELSQPPAEPFSAFGGTPSMRSGSIKEKDDAWWSRLIRRRSSAVSIRTTKSADGEPRPGDLGFGAVNADGNLVTEEKDTDNISLRSAASPETPVFTSSSTFPTTSKPLNLNPNIARVQSTLSDNASVNTESSEKKRRFGNLRFAGLSPIGSRREPLPSDTPLPFIDEIQLILTTFILPGSSKELNINARLRRHILKSLQPLDEEGNKLPPVTTHPDVFKEAADHAYTLMERSLPHYLQWAKQNTNTPKMLFWTFVGFVDFMIGIMIALVIMFRVRARGWRAFSFIFIQFGIMQSYSASRYFCSQVHGRTARQLYPWELTTELSTEDLGTTNVFATTKAADSSVPMTQDQKVKADLASAMPFLFEDEPGEKTVAPSEKPMPHRKEPVFRSRFFASLRTKEGKKIKAFGPERVVEDPYIKALHNKQIKEILIVGLIGMLCVEAIILAIPEQ